MKKNIACAAAMLAFALTVTGCAPMTPAQGWTTLIDGATGMDNFTISGATANWRGEDGAIVADKITSGTGASVLITKKDYRDVEIYAEFWSADDTNSGIYLRAPDIKMVNTASGALEVQIWDRNPAQNYATGSLVNVASANGKYNAAGRWNSYEVHAKGSEITVKLNGVVTSSTSYAKTQAGRIGLQFNAGGAIKFRKLAVREL
ncbi:MAG: DUF1080 domain-containing protein [Burkholderiales bacterium]|nr:DUF1080 domain-containing protein [Burkholderiales bacterium]